MLNRNKNYFFLRQIVITSFLSSLSIILRISLFSFKKKFIPFSPFFYRIFLVDLVPLFSIIPLLFLPLYSSIFFCFLGAFISEASIFFLRSSKYIYNPFLSLTYAFCFGILPSFFLKRKNFFYSVYFSLLFIFIIYFCFYVLLNLFFLNFIIKFRNNKLNNFNILIFKNFLLIRFLFLFFYSFVFSYLYLKIKNVILGYTSEYYRPH
ncbi:hypothetical protein [Candidatus Phytoplasma oryzae]|nr:hypothetical protein PIE28_02200 [Candidatus Phytoplasma oryzae]